MDVNSVRADLAAIRVRFILTDSGWLFLPGQGRGLHAELE